jgi:hypothetical protein
MKRIMRSFKLNEISAVDRPAQAHAKVVLMKRDDDPYYRDGTGKITGLHVSGDIGSVKRDFSASERRSDAKSGAAMPDGSFPIEDAEDLANARRLAGKAKDPAAARAHIASRAKALGLSKLDELIEEYIGQEDNAMNLVIDQEQMQKAVDAAVVEIRKEFEDRHKEMAEKLAKAEAGLIKANMTEAESEYYDKATDPGKAEFAGMTPDERKKTMKRVIEDTIPPEIRKQLAEAEALKKQVSSLVEDRAVDAFAKRAIDLGVEGHGETLRKAYGGNAEAIIKLESILKGLAEQVRTGKVFTEFGSNQSNAGVTAKDDMDAAAAAYREGQIKIGKNCSIEQAFTKVYTDPAYAELKKRYDTEDMKKRHAA